MTQKINIAFFFELLRAGLWGGEVRLLPFEGIDFDEVYVLAREQSVVGLAAAGLEHIVDKKPTKQQVSRFIGNTLRMEKKNLAMNRFIAKILTKMREQGIYTLLVKGQGIAQCYERPLWRANGDVDLLLDADNYVKAKTFLEPISTETEPESVDALQYCVHVGPWSLELHGTLRCRLSARMDKVIDEVQRDTFEGGNVRLWKNDDVDIYMPGVDNDIVFIFTHFLKHFYKGGIGLRQICDWCRLLWTYRGNIDVDLLTDRIQRMRLMSEWKAFAAFAVDHIGMPAEAMPLYDASRRWSRKARRIKSFILKVGNFGHNRDMSYFEKYPFLIRKTISLWQRLGDICRHALIFPLDSLRFLHGIMFNGLKAAAKGE